MKFYILSYLILIFATSCDPTQPISSENQINQEDSVIIQPVDKVKQDTSALVVKDTRKFYAISKMPNFEDALILWWMRLQKEDNDLLTDNILNDNYSIFIWESNESNGLAKKGKEFLLQYIAGVKNFPDNIILGKYENLLTERDQLSNETVLIGFYIKGEDIFEAPLDVTDNRLNSLVYISK